MTALATVTTTATRAHVAAGVLSLIAGLSDCLGWVLLKGTFTAHITGNVVVVAADSARALTPSIAAVLGIPVFILVTSAATLLDIRLGRPALVQRWLLCAQTLLLVAAAACASAAHASSASSTAPVLATVLLTVAAMAVQNALLHLVVAPAPSTAVMTGNLVVATVALVRLLFAGTGRPAAARTFAGTWPLIAGFTAGCVVAAVAAGAVADTAWFLPAGVSLAATVWLWPDRFVQDSAGAAR